MPDPASRYANVEVSTTTIADGTGARREVRFLRRRFLPQPETAQIMAEHPVQQGDRIDVVTAVRLGDPLQFWRVCDANRCIHPGELTDTSRIGERIRIAVPGV